MDEDEKTIAVLRSLLVEKQSEVARLRAALEASRAERGHVTRFRGVNKFLSNFYEAAFEFEGVTYHTVEHAYQERKTADPERKALIRGARTAMEAARLGRAKETVLRPDWFEPDTKRDVMEPLVFAKFRQNPELSERLAQTGGAFLMEGNYWHDNYFGACSCRKCHEAGEGQNHLGRILMKVRSTLSGGGQTGDDAQPSGASAPPAPSCAYCDEPMELRWVCAFDLNHPRKESAPARSEGKCDRCSCPYGSTGKSGYCSNCGCCRDHSRHGTGQREG